MSLQYVNPFGYAKGISNEAESSQQQKQLRPKRALTKDFETGNLVLTKFSLEAADAQARNITLVASERSVIY